MDDRSDAELLQASAHDGAAFRVLYDRWAERLMVYFYRRTFDPEVSADLVAETFAVAFRRRAAFRDVGRPGGAWLFGIARRELARFRRRRRVELRAVRKLGVTVPVMDDESIARVEELVDAAALRNDIEAALARLSERERSAVRLRVVDQLSYGAVGEALGCSEGAARVRVHRALSHLAEMLEAP